MGETNYPPVAHVGYDITPLSRIKFNSLEWRNIVTHGQLKENLYITFLSPILLKILTSEVIFKGKWYVRMLLANVVVFKLVRNHFQFREYELSGISLIDAILQMRM